MKTCDYSVWQSRDCSVASCKAQRIDVEVPPHSSFLQAIQFRPPLLQELLQGAPIETLYEYLRSFQASAARHRRRSGREYFTAVAVAARELTTAFCGLLEKITQRAG